MFLIDFYGSWCYIWKVFSGVKALVISQYGSLAASSRTRVFQYLPFLEAKGVEVDLVVVVPDELVSSTTSTSILRRSLYYLRCFLNTFRAGLHCVWSASDYHVIYVQKVLFPFPFPELLRHYRHKVVFDFDDAIFTTEAPSESWLARLRTIRHQSGLPRMLKSSGHTIVENGYTGGHAARYGSKVEFITGPIDTAQYSPGSAGRDAQLVLGWIGSKTTTRYLELIRAPLVEIKSRFPDLSIRLVGADAVSLDGLEVENLDWSLESEVRHLRTFHIGLMPLTDDPWTRGKGGYKLLQYMALGIPAVASPIGINKQIVEDGVDGYLAETDEEWIDRLSKLIVSSDLRGRMGKAGREKMIQEYSLEEASDKLLCIFQSAAGT